MQIPDQRPIWEAKHEADVHAMFRGKSSPFGERAELAFMPGSRILDLGCGVGGDAVFFALQGHEVIATDFSSTVLGQNMEHASHPDVHYVQNDMSDGLPFGDNVFDAVFAQLSIHYFDDETTRRIIDEIDRVLMPSGIFAFACKSTNDPDYGQGKELASDLFAASSGHVRHFFSDEYVSDLLSGRFNLVDYNGVVEEYYVNKRVNFVQCIARKAMS